VYRRLRPTLCVCTRCYELIAMRSSTRPTVAHRHCRPAAGGSRRAAGGVEVIVSDSGVGINIEDQNRIFDKFYRTEGPELHSTSKTRLWRWARLGLTIAKGSSMLMAGGSMSKAKAMTRDVPWQPLSRFAADPPTWASFRRVPRLLNFGGNQDAGRVLNQSLLATITTQHTRGSSVNDQDR